MFSPPRKARSTLVGSQSRFKLWRTYSAPVMRSAKSQWLTTSVAFNRTERLFHHGWVSFRKPTTGFHVNHYTITIETPAKFSIDYLTLHRFQRVNVGVLMEKPEALPLPTLRRSKSPSAASAHGPLDPSTAAGDAAFKKSQ